jgi:hypothetical protein
MLFFALRAAAPMQRRRVNALSQAPCMRPTAPCCSPVCQALNNKFIFLVVPTPYIEATLGVSRSICV